jgi:hypothetical protein
MTRAVAPQKARETGTPKTGTPKTGTQMTARR